MRRCADTQPLAEVFSSPTSKGCSPCESANYPEELGFDRERIQGWAFAQAVLSACWTYEDHGYGWEGVMQLAAVLAAIKTCSSG